MCCFKEESLQVILFILFQVLLQCIISYSPVRVECVTIFFKYGLYGCGGAVIIDRCAGQYLFRLLSRPSNISMMRTKLLGLPTSIAFEIVATEFLVRNCRCLKLRYHIIVVACRNKMAYR